MESFSPKIVIHRHAYTYFMDPAWYNVYSRYSSSIAPPYLLPTSGIDTPCEHGVSIPLLYSFYSVDRE
jgi:hypothetical protein